MRRGFIGTVIAFPFRCVLSILRAIVATIEF
jgi:hypothetical protein